MLSFVNFMPYLLLYKYTIQILLKAYRSIFHKNYLIGFSYSIKRANIVALCQVNSSSINRRINCTYLKNRIYHHLQEYFLHSQIVSRIFALIGLLSETLKIKHLQIITNVVSLNIVSRNRTQKQIFQKFYHNFFLYIFQIAFQVGLTKRHAMCSR